MLALPGSDRRTNTVSAQLAHLLVNFIGDVLDFLDLAAIHGVQETMGDDVACVVDGGGVLFRDGELPDAVPHVSHQPLVVVAQQLHAAVEVLHAGMVLHLLPFVLGVDLPGHQLVVHVGDDSDHPVSITGQTQLLGNN